MLARRFRSPPVLLLVGAAIILGPIDVPRPGQRRSSGEPGIASLDAAGLSPSVVRRVTPTRGWLLLAMVLLVAFAGLAVLVPGATVPVDASLLTEAARLRDTALWPLLNAITLVGYPLPWDAAVVAITIVLAVRLQRALPLLLPAWLVVGEAAAVLAKLLEDRPRPPGVTIEDLVTEASFPSGHVTRVAVTAGVALVLAWPALRPGQRTRAAAAGAAAVALMAVARVASGQHWPSDVVGAILLGGAVVAAFGATRSVAGAGHGGPES